MSAIVGTKQYLEYFNHPGSTLQGGITASMSAGSFLGCILSGSVCDILGRKKTIQFSCIFWIIGSVLQCASQNVAMLIVGRVLNGLTVGFTSSQVPVYLSEISKRSVRGKIVGLQQWAIEWGILIMFFIGYGCSYIKGHASFRVPWIIQVVPALFLMFLLIFIPESPRWLASKGRWDECKLILANIHGKGDDEDPEVLTEIAEIQEFVEIENKQAIGYLELYNKKNIYKTLVAQACQCSQQLVGGNVIMYYVVYVFQMAGLTGSINLISSSVQYIIFLLFTVPTLFMMDKVGRRPLMIYGSIAMGTCMFIIAGILAGKGEYAESIGGNDNIHITLVNSPAASRTVLVFSYLFTMFYSLTWAPTAWVYCPEVFDQRTRCRGMAVAAASNWAMNFALAFYVPPAFDNIGWKTFVIFGVFNAASAIYIFFLFPETAKKSLEEIEELFASNSPKPWKTKVGSERFEQTKEEFKQNPIQFDSETQPKSSLENKAEAQHVELAESKTQNSV
ncbi:High-affinity glucose transporter [Wickerhamomyces ciferrii]|uniref:High-affinity glucose transporter n=1 Tax=Wickerhamomyces ciferrii (strain ATCC 14091 / BCRC 22168 / CBS 111 / JCM 3599 / NBRC 0793 / NRRL Y-1031 F-60-10) TaxID=1206466 RepID=K0KRN7_WICCF|nr:High-affinity glucose transporter [Wickerhamomyces ciferrii]CCH45756.1 High-affinity glucose transporter [Wickerhamomyces ciferrii]